MKLTLRQAGGVAGIARPPAEVDTAELSSPARDHLHRLVAAVGMDRIPARLGRVHPDEVSYELVIARGDGTTRSVEFTHASAPAELRALAAEIRAMRGARPRPG